jgi:hypothetical protein
MLGIPDAAYAHWEVRVDLMQIAHFGAGRDTHRGQRSLADGTASQRQVDKVNVTLKRKSRKRGTGE